MRGLTRTILITGLLSILGNSSFSQPKRATPTTSNTKAFSAREIAEKFLPSVVLIVCDDGKGSISQGSGFFLSDGKVLTNYHVIERMVRGKVKAAAGGKDASEWWIYGVDSIDKNNDIALLSIELTKNKPDLTESDGLRGTGSGQPPKGLTVSKSKDLKIGDDVYVLGNPKGLVGTISRGLISGGIRKARGIEFLQIDAAISSGSSGGAVLNSRGEVVGIASGSIKDGQNLNFAVPASTILKFINSFKEKSLGAKYRSASVFEHSWRIDQESMRSEAKGTAKLINETIQALEFVDIPDGEIYLSSPKEGEAYARLFNIRRFQIGRFEVTREQWRVVMGENSSEITGCPKCPVDSISVGQIDQFLSRLNTNDSTFVYRLPTESEWVYAARAGEKSDGEYLTNVGVFAWYFENSGGKSHPVGTKEPNRWGIYDMYGNVWEYTSDRYSSYIVAKGHSNNDREWFIRSDSSSFQNPSIPHQDHGFRLVREKRTR